MTNKLIEEIKELQKGQFVVNITESYTKKDKSSVYTLKADKNKLDLMYTAMLLLNPEYKELEYQCNKKELEVFRKIVIGAFVLHSLKEHTINDRK